MIAIGFPPSHQEQVWFRDVSGPELRDALDEAFHRLGWAAQRTGRWELRANTGVIPFVTWGNTVIARVEGEGELFVRSECSVPLQWIDWGSNSSNVNALLAKLEKLLDARPRKRRDD
jgi:hypothetical protein